MGGSTIVVTSNLSGDASTASAQNWYKYGGYLATTTTAANCEAFTQVPGVASNLLVKVSANTVASAVNLQFRVTAANGNLVVSITALTTGTFEDTTHTDTLVATDQLCYLYDQTGIIQSTTFTVISTLFTATTNTTTFEICSGSVTGTSGASTNYYMQVAGRHGTQTTEASTKTRFRKAGTLENLFVRIDNNSRITNTVVRTRKNGANGNQFVTFTSGLNAQLEDTTNTDTVAIGDDFNYQLANGTGTQTYNTRVVKTEFLSTAGDSPIYAGETVPATIADATTMYYPISGRCLPSATESVAQIKMRHACTISEFIILITANAINASSTVTVRKGAAAGNNTVTVTTTAVGLFNDTTHTDTIVSGNLIDIEYVAASVAGSVTTTVAWMGMNLAVSVGGTNFDRPLTAETISISESIARLYGSNRPPAAQTTTISESMLRDFDGVRAIAAQTITIGESQTRLFSANRPITAETNTIGESLARLYASTRTLSDTTIISESLARLQGLTRALTVETVAISESLVRVFGVVRSLSQTTVIGESLARLLAAIRALSDTSTISEAIAKVQVLVRSLSDTTAISESLTKILTLVRNIPIQTTTIGESLARVFVGVRVLSDTSAISESLVRLKAANRALSAETTAISESLVRTFGVVRSLSDTTVIGESLTRLLAAIRALAAQTTTVGESLTKVQTLIRSLADTTIISETLSRLLAAIRALSDTSAISESLTKIFTPASGVTFTRPLTAETIAISESLARVTSNVRSLIETTIIGESLTRLFNGVRVLAAQTTTISESLTSVKTLVRTLSVQTTAISESLIKVQTIIRSLTDTTAITETINRLQALTRTLTAETTAITGTVASAIIHAYTKALSETITISESLTKFATRARNLIETVIIDESLSRVQVLTRALTTEITNISGTLSAVTGAFEAALTEIVTISDSLLTTFLHITKGPPLYQQIAAKVEGVAKPNRSMERESESYVRKQFEKLVRRIYGTGRKYRSG